MAEKKERSEAQKAADRRYMEKNRQRYAKTHDTFSTSMPKAEKEEIQTFCKDNNIKPIEIVRRGYSEHKKDKGLSD